MAGKKYFFLIGLFAVCLSPVFAQSFFIDRGEDEPRFIQRLIWEDARYFSRYVVIIERQEQDGNYHEAQRDTVVTNFIDVSLYPGQYRFRVEVYDILDEFAFSTPWQAFYITRALQPELTAFSPHAFFLDGNDPVLEITLYGENLLSDSEFYLTHNGTTIIPLRHSVEDGFVLLVFSIDSLIPGQYNIGVRNPGGLDALLGTFTITGSGSSFALNISVGFSPILPLYGFLWNDFRFEGSTVTAPFPASFYPLGISARISYFPFRRFWGNMGIELSSSLSLLEHEREYHTASATFLNTHIGFLYQRYFLERNFAYNIVLGVGVTTLMDFHYTYQVAPQTENRTDHYASTIAGFSVIGFFPQPFFISAGVDFIHIFSPEGSAPGFIRPSVAVGVRL